MEHSQYPFCIVLFGFVFSLAYTPLQAVYPTEVLQYNTRAKGMALYEMIHHDVIHVFELLIANILETLLRSVVLALSMYMQALSHLDASDGK